MNYIAHPLLTRCATSPLTPTPTALRQAPFDEGDVIVAMAFLQPGRHAGEGGDVAQIIERALAGSPGLRVHLTPLLASQPLVHEVLRDRVRAAEEACVG